VFFTHIRDAQEAKEEVEKDLRKHLRYEHGTLHTIHDTARHGTTHVANHPTRPVINTLGPHVEKGEPDWSAVKIRYEEPKTLALPVTAGTAPRPFLTCPTLSYR
jgi:predicted small metal-binding protein